jgi:DNA-binding LacI/PurR family transcriptional regulator
MTNHELTDRIRVIAGGYNEDDGAAAARQLLSEGPPTAVIAANDPCAIGVLDTLTRAGRRVPEDISVIGYDDARFGRLPGIDLTSVRRNVPKMARLAVTSVVGRLDQPDRKITSKVLRPKLVIRGTTAAPPHNTASR